MEENQRPNKKGKTIFSFFEKKKSLDVGQDDVVIPVSNPISPSEVAFSKEFEIERDPGLRKQIYEYPVNQRDEIRRAYINVGPYQPKLSEYPKSVFGTQYRRFQYTWFKKFPWLEYSPSKDKAYCFPCFLFDQSNKSSSHSSLIGDGFNNWRRVNLGEKCVFIVHVGLASSSHMRCVSCLDSLKKSSHHIDKVMNAQSREEILRNRKRVIGTIETILIVAFQGLGLRGHDESSSSLNQGNFIELLKFKAKGNDLENLILDKAPKNAKYSSPMIQKEILHILANRVKKMICEEIGGGKFCILVDESQDESRREQMALVLRYVKHDGSLVERFFDIFGVENTSAITLKNEISSILTQHSLSIQNMRGQGYDGASNMRGEWNGLQALFLRECPYAYYIHCFAHRLQLALVAAAKDEPNVWQFFSYLTCIVNLISSSPKRVSELKNAQRIEIDSMLASGERQSGKGANQMGNLQRAGATRWSSHYESVKSMIDMYSASCVVIGDLRKNGQNQQIRGQALGVFNVMMSFDFIFILHLMNKIMEITDTLCQALQRKSQDVVSAMKLVSTTKALLQQFRDDGWDNFLAVVFSFCSRHDINITNMSSIYEEGTSRRCQQRDHITIEHHYHFDVFNTTIDHQLMELKHRFDDVVVELLSLSAALDPSFSFRSFNEDKICMLAAKFYPHDFSAQDVRVLRSQLMHYKLNVVSDPDFQNIPSLPDLCRELVATRKFENYFMLEKLIRLVLVLPVSTAST